MTNKELISKSEVEKILKHWFPMHWHWENYYFIEQIKSLPTFSPEAIIEEMIEEEKNTPLDFPHDEHSQIMKLICYQNVLDRIRAENIS